MTYELTRRRVLGAAGTAAAVALASVPATAQGSTATDWPHRRHDAANTSYNAEASGPRERPAVTKLLSTQEQLSEAVVVADSELYTQQRLGTLSVRGDTGQERWSRFTGDRAGGGLPVAVAHEQVYVLTPAGRVAAMDVESGNIQWRRTPTGLPWLSVTVDAVYEVVGQQLTALRPDGAEQWQREFQGRVRSAAANGQTVYVATDTKVVAVGTDGSTTRWEREVVTRGAPVFSDGQLYLRARNDDGTEDLLALEAATGEEVWRGGDLPSPITTSPAVAGAILFVGAGENPLGDTFHAVNALTGDIEWRTQLGNPASASASPAATRPAVTSETAYVTSADGTVNALDARSGEQLFRETFDADPGPPVPANGKLYVALDERELVAFEATDEGDDGGEGNDDDTDSQPDDGGSQDDGSSGDDGSSPDDSGNETASQDSDDSGPGFGVAGALAGLGGAYLLGRRRRRR